MIKQIDLTSEKSKRDYSKEYFNKIFKQHLTGGNMERKVQACQFKLEKKMSI